jgi:hypothetical protein
MDKNVINHWKQNLPNIIQGYDTRDIWNVDETRLLWKGVPNRSLVQQGEKCKAGKLTKEKLTIALLCSATGEKFNPLVIGKSQMPRAFNKQLPRRIIWKANSKTWMTGTIFLEYLQKFNAKMQIKNGKALIFLDNAPCHPKMELSNVKLVFLPPNTTTGTQPLDFGIIRNLKVKYRKMHPEFLLSHEDVIALADAVKKVNVGDVVDWVSQSWDQVVASTIKNCFQKASLNKDAIEPD